MSTTLDPLGTAGAGRNAEATPPAANRATLFGVNYTKVNNDEKITVDSCMTRGPDANRLRNNLAGGSLALIGLVALAAVALTVLALTGTFTGMPGINTFAQIVQNAGSSWIILTYAGSALVGLLALSALWKGTQWACHASKFDKEAAARDMKDVNAAFDKQGQLGNVFAAVKAEKNSPVKTAGDEEALKRNLVQSWTAAQEANKSCLPSWMQCGKAPAKA